MHRGDAISAHLTFDRIETAETVHRGSAQPVSGEAVTPPVIRKLRRRTFCASQVAEDFGRGLVPALFDIYVFLVGPSWNFFEFILKTEPTIHRGVKLNSRGARPPVVQAVLIGSKTIKISYRSERRLCRVAIGIIRGAASRYGVEISVAEQLCMLRGDPECLIMVAGTV